MNKKAEEYLMRNKLARRLMIDKKHYEARIADNKNNRGSVTEAAFNDGLITGYHIAAMSNKFLLKQILEGEIDG